VLRGGQGSDTMLGGAGIDDLDGEKGADSLHGGGGTPDKCVGGLDTDVDVADAGSCELIVNVP
jgi:Ca2+-binding RTX toxin-like protein